jgi:hypothetical protein
VDSLEGVDIYEPEGRLSDVESRVDDACSTLAFDLAEHLAPMLGRMEEMPAAPDLIEMARRIGLR